MPEPNRLPPILADGLGSEGIQEHVLDGVEYVAIAIELLAIVIIAIAIISATWQYLERRLHQQDPAGGYHQYRAQLGSGLLLGLEVLVAADVIRTVALEQTLESVLTLGVLVLIRIILGWSIVVEIERRWPWQAPREENSGDTPQAKSLRQ